MLVITHAGWDAEAVQGGGWGLWVEDSATGEQWYIPTDEATVEALLLSRETGVERIPAQG